MTDLGIVLELTGGISAVFIGFVMPAMLSFKVHQCSTERLGDGVYTRLYLSLEYTHKFLLLPCADEQRPRLETLEEYARYCTGMQGE